MLKKIVSGCQTGADIAGIDAAIANDFPYDGWVPKGKKTEVGPLPNSYIVKEMQSAGYPKRTEQNVKDSDGTVIFTHCKLSGGSDLTRKYAIKHHKPWLHLNLSEISSDEAVQKLEKFVKSESVLVLNVAGRSASKDPEIYKEVYCVVDTFLKKNS